MDHAGSWHRVFLNLLHEAVEAENFQEAAVFRDYTTRMESVDLLGEALDVRFAHTCLQLLHVYTASVECCWPAWAQCCQDSLQPGQVGPGDAAQLLPLHHRPQAHPSAESHGDALLRSHSMLTAAMPMFGGFAQQSWPHSPQCTCRRTLALPCRPDSNLGKLRAVLQALDVALEEEDYGAASLVRDNAGLQYRGWWLGTSSAHNEPHLLRVESCFGRMAGFRLSISDIVQVEV